MTPDALVVGAVGSPEEIGTPGCHAYLPVRPGPDEMVLCRITDDGVEVVPRAADVTFRAAGG